MADTYYMKDNPQSYDVSSDVKEIDRELEELLKKQIAKIKVVGVGGGGGNSLSRMREIGIKGGELIAINTDAQEREQGQLQSLPHWQKNRELLQ